MRRRKLFAKPGGLAFLRHVWEKGDPALAVVRYDPAFAAWQMERRDHWRRELADLKEKLRPASSVKNGRAAAEELRNFIDPLHGHDTCPLRNWIRMTGGHCSGGGGPC